MLIARMVGTAIAEREDLRLRLGVRFAEARIAAILAEGEHHRDLRVRAAIDSLLPVLERELALEVRVLPNQLPADGGARDFPSRGRVRDAEQPFHLPAELEREGAPQFVVVLQRDGALEAHLRRAWSLLGLLIVCTALFLGLVFAWSRRRVLGSVNSLVSRIEQADPDHPERVRLPSLAVAEIERLRLAFAGFFARFAAGRARQTEAEGTLGQVLKDAADAILVLDRDHRVVQWNRGAEETFGYRAEEIVGRPYVLLCPDEVEEPAFLGRDSAVKDLRTRRRRRDGEVIDVSLARSRLSFSRDGEERFVEIARDISLKRRLEEELLQSEKMAAVGKISSKVVHEIRNPLAAIHLNVDLLTETLEEHDALCRERGLPTDPEAAEILEVLKRETRRLSQIADEYLQFSRLPRAAFRVESINRIVAELAELLRLEAGRRRIALQVELDPDDPPAICDASLVRQALLNLLRNALDAVSPGEGAIRLRTERRGPEILLEVSDNGRGIQAEVRERIFEPFFTTKQDGTGLGLDLVRRAAQEHGGRVECDSTPGEGASFRLLLPLDPMAHRTESTEVGTI
ncbi:MAG: PAS domain S-box protein [Candidatus Eisenbacteria bacterium]|nr:PAS domain S-box protein [Candidatus Eisenbacteria bacterium]